MNYLDIILIIPLVWGVIKGLKNGIIKELAALLALIFGIYGAVYFSSDIQNLLSDGFKIESSLIGIISFTSTLLIIIVIVNILGFIIDKIINAVALGILNRFLGGVFGLIKNALILSALLIIVNNLDSHLKLIPQDQKNQSVLYKPASKVIPSFITCLTSRDYIIERSSNIWKGNIIKD